MPPEFNPKAFDTNLAHVKRPTFISAVSGGGGTEPPSESPLKVWDGAEWVPVAVDAGA